MLYRVNKKNNDNLSLLGFGCMRLPQKNGGIDYETVKMQITYAIENGVNYFDTAYVYHGGKSETVLGKILKETGNRDKVKIADKLPQYMVRKFDDIDKIFGKQLHRLQTDRIDYYLMHMLQNLSSWERLVKMGIAEWIEKKKKSGQIKNIGFSFHGGKNDFIELIDAYPWDFTQIQYNYLDENNQATKDGLKYAADKGIPVIIMEPLRGGRLVNGLPDKAKKILDEVNSEYSYAEWAFRWLFNQEDCTCVLSGMTQTEQLKENIQLASAPVVILDKEREAYERVKEIIGQSIKIECTGCSYCMPCNSGVNIPNCFSCYNDIALHNKRFAFMQYFKTSGAISASPSFASNCTGCGECEKRCPQKIEIRKKLKMVEKELHPFWFKPGLFIFRKLYKVNKGKGE